MKDGVYMNLDTIHLVNQKGHFFLIDSHRCKTVLLSEKAYQILNAYKNGIEISKLSKDFSPALVDSILNQLETLRDKNTIAEDKTDYYKKTKNAISKLADQKSLALTEGVFMVAHDCNLQCRYCYGGTSGSFQSKGFMSRQMAEEYLHYFLSTGSGKPYQKIVFFGGEPTLNMDVVAYIIELWEKWKHNYNGRKLRFSMTTNGTLLTPEIIEYLKCKEIDINISLDGPEGIHNANRVFADGQGTFDKVMEGINLLRKYEMHFTVRSTVCRNVDYDQLFEFFDKQNFKQTYLVAVGYPELFPQKDYQMDAGSFLEFTEKHQQIISEGCKSIIDGDEDSFNGKQMNNAFKNIKYKGKEIPFVCGAGSWSAAFGIDGYIYPCHRFVGEKPYHIGNIKQGIDIGRVMMFYNNFLDASKSCDSCWAVSMCGHRCFRQKATGDGGFEQIPEKICDVYRVSYASTIISYAELMNQKKKICE
jgi:radical SAM additional 4Fe4S-binding domain